MNAVDEYIKENSEVHQFAAEVARIISGIPQIPEFSNERLTVKSVSKIFSESRNHQSELASSMAGCRSGQLTGEIRLLRLRRNRTSEQNMSFLPGSSGKNLDMSGKERQLWMRKLDLTKDVPATSYTEICMEFALESGQELYVDGKKIYTSDMEYVGEIE